MRAPAASTSRRGLARYPSSGGGPRRRGEGRRERKKQKRNCRTTLSALLRRANGKYLSVIFIGAPSIARRDASGGRRGRGDDSATFIIKSRLLAFTPRRNGEIQDPRRYTVAHRATARNALTFKTCLDGDRALGKRGRARGRERDTLDAAAIAGTLAVLSCTKLRRRVSLLRMEADVRPGAVLLNRGIMESVRRGLMPA